MNYPENPVVTHGSPNYEYYELSGKMSHLTVFLVLKSS